MLLNHQMEMGCCSPLHLKKLRVYSTLNPIWGKAFPRIQASRAADCRQPDAASFQHPNLQCHALLHMLIAGLLDAADSCTLASPIATITRQAGVAAMISL